MDNKFIYRMLNNCTYIGEAVHKGASYPGEHAAIIDRDVWDKVRAILTESPRKRAARTRAETPALLKGLLFVPDGAAFSPTHTFGVWFRITAERSRRRRMGDCAARMAAS
jgi:site-specific DNA recombinase